MTRPANLSLHALGTIAMYARIDIERLKLVRAEIRDGRDIKLTYIKQETALYEQLIAAIEQLAEYPHRL